MIRDTLTTSALLVVCVLCIGAMFSLDGLVMLRLSLLAVSLPFGFAGLWQWRTIAARGQAQIETLLNRDLNGSGLVGDVVIPEQPKRQALPPVERVRLIPAHVASSAVVMPSDVRSLDETARVVAVPPVRTVDDVNEQDLIEFVNGLPMRGHARRGWLGFKFVSGREVDADYHAMLIKPLEKCGAIVERGERKAGKVVMSSDDIIERLGLGRPDDGADA